MCKKERIMADDVIEYGEGDINEPIPIEFEAANNSEKMYKIINLEKIDGIYYKDKKEKARKYSAVIQASYISSNYIFFVRCVNSNAYLFRCKLPDKGNIIDAKNAEKMTLVGFGHTQTLEVYKYENEWYVLIGCKGVMDEMDKDKYENGALDVFAWSTQICRIKFEKDKEIRYTTCSRLSGMNYIGGLGNIGTVRRVEAAMSTNNKYMLLWTRTYAIKNGKRHSYKTRFAIYNAKKINDAWNNAKEGTALSCDSKEIKEALVETGFQYDSGKYNLRVGSNQGLEISNSKEIYICSEEMANKQSKGTYIYKIDNKGKELVCYEFKGDKLGKGAEKELEGLQIKAAKLWFIAKDYSQPNNIHYVYRIDPGIIK